MSEDKGYVADLKCNLICAERQIEKLRCELEGRGRKFVNWGLIPEKVVLIARSKSFKTLNTLQEFFVDDSKLCSYPDHMSDIQLCQVIAIRPGSEITVANALINNMNTDINSSNEPLKPQKE